MYVSPYACVATDCSFIDFVTFLGLVPFQPHCSLWQALCHAWKPETLDLCSQDIPLELKPPLILLLALGCTEVELERDGDHI